jgi:hypothetical protein
MKLQIQLPTGAWQYVTETPEGFGYSIYPNRSIDGNRIEEVKAKHPQFEFKQVDSRI